MPAEPGERFDWGRVAAAYRLQLPLERRALGAAIELAAATGSDRLLDLATGPAALPRLLARGPDPPAEMVGVDASARMLAAAPAVPGLRLLRAEAAALPFPDARFDVVTVAYLLHLLGPERRARALAEAHRVLRPGGRLVTVTVAAPPPALAAPAFAALGRRRPGVLAGMRPLDPRPDLAAAGFRLRAGRLTTRGYPSLVVLAARNAR